MNLTCGGQHGVWVIFTIFRFGIKKTTLVQIFIIIYGFVKDLKDNTGAIMVLEFMDNTAYE